MLFFVCLFVCVYMLHGVFCSSSDYSWDSYWHKSHFLHFWYSKHHSCLSFLVCFCIIIFCEWLKFDFKIMFFMSTNLQRRIIWNWSIALFEFFCLHYCWNRLDQHQINHPRPLGRLCSAMNEGAPLQNWAVVLLQLHSHTIWLVQLCVVTDFYQLFAYQFMNNEF